MSMDQSVSQELTHRSCSQCGASSYDASLTCHSCQNKSEACCVSGQLQKPAYVVCISVGQCLYSKAMIYCASCTKAPAAATAHAARLNKEDKLKVFVSMLESSEDTK